MVDKTDSTNIKNLEGLLQSVVDVSKITDIKISRLTAPGENFGSVMLKLDITFGNTEDVLHLVGKKIPSEEYLQENFNIQVTFKNEVGMYESIVSTLQKFQKENGMENVFDCLPRFYCARFNLDGGEQIDEDAVLILENLVAKGYSNVDRLDGFNLESTKVILKDLAEFHAVPLALKLKKPEVFESEVKKYCDDFRFGREFHKIFWGITKDVLLENENCASLVDKVHFLGESERPEVTELYGTLAHADLWSNNTMQKFAAGQIAISNKFVDFQFLSYGSAACDFFFFVFTSVKLEVLKLHLDDLIKCYHSHFLKTLEELSCDITPFSLNSFLEEIKRQCVFEVGHAMQFALFIINGQKGDKQLKLPEEINKVIEAITMKAKEHVWFIAEECYRRVEFKSRMQYWTYRGVSVLPNVAAAGISKEILLILLCQDIFY